MTDTAMPERTEVLRSDLCDVTTYSHGRSGTNDHSRSGLEVREIQGCDGNTHRPIWRKDWREVVPGVETRRDHRHGQVRIHRSACPVRILFHQWSEYGTHGRHRPASQSSKSYWVCYVARTAAEEA